MKHLLKFTIAAFVVFNFGCSNNTEHEHHEDSDDIELTTEEEEAQTKSVLEHHLKAFQENDMEALLSDYTDESVLISPDSMYTGLEELRSLFTELMAAFPTEGTTMDLDKMEINGELAYILWHAKTPVLDVSFASDTYIIEDGKIEYQTFAGVMSPVEAPVEAEDPVVE